MKSETTAPEPTKAHLPTLVMAWLAVGLPLLWGVVMSLKKAMALFH
jgi:hypothetical protein